MLDAKEPTYTVELDAGAFRGLWELVEKEARHRFPAAQTISSYRSYLRGVEAFRKAWWDANPSPEAPPTPRKLVRRKR